MQTVEDFVVVSRHKGTYEWLARVWTRATRLDGLEGPVRVVYDDRGVPLGLVMPGRREEMYSDDDPRFEDYFVPAVTVDATAEDVRGKLVVGNVPLALASLAHEVWAVEFSGKAPRGAEYTADDMEAAGARLVRYTVQAGDPLAPSEVP